MSTICLEWGYSPVLLAVVVAAGSNSLRSSHLPSSPDAKVLASVSQPPYMLQSYARSHSIRIHATRVPHVPGSIAADTCPLRTTVSVMPCRSAIPGISVVVEQSDFLGNAVLTQPPSPTVLSSTEPDLSNLGVVDVEVLAFWLGVEMLTRQSMVYVRTR